MLQSTQQKNTRARLQKFNAREHSKTYHCQHRETRNSCMVWFKPETSRQNERALTTSQFLHGLVQTCRQEDELAIPAGG
jgi:hypothetical protein